MTTGAAGGPPWEDRRAPLFRNYLLNLSGSRESSEAFDFFLSQQADEAFPSGDSTAAACLFTCLCIMGGHPAFYCIVPCVMFLRVYFLCHHLFDCFVGALVGTVPPLLLDAAWGGWENLHLRYVLFEAFVVAVVLTPFLFRRHARLGSRAASSGGDGDNFSRCWRATYGDGISEL